MSRVVRPVQTQAAAAPRDESRPLRVIGLATFPVEAAATRFRLAQFLPHLHRHAMAVTLLPFLDSAAFADLYIRRKSLLTTLRLFASFFRRLAQLPRILRADVLFVQREAMIAGPPLIEWLAVRVARVPMVLDLDDATWIVKDSPVYGRLARILKWSGKTDRLIRWSQVVICGNETIAAHVRSLGSAAVVIPSVVDTETFRPVGRESGSALPVVGWIGTHSTWPYLQAILPAIERAAATVPFRLRIVGSGCKNAIVAGVECEFIAWTLDTEVREFQGLDVGLYPLPVDAWADAKSGLKAVQYLAAGVPFVASPVGIVASVGVPGETHLLASDEAGWSEALCRLVRDAELRRTMSLRARKHALERYGLEPFAETLAAAIRMAAIGTVTVD